MRKYLILALLVPVACFSQQKNTKKLNLHTITSIGVASGEAGRMPVTQISAGISYGPWFSGLGVGVDFYEFHSIPVFADWRFNFGPKRRLELYINAGYNFHTADKEQFVSSFFTDKDLKGGFFGDGGLGFKIPAGRYHRFGLSIGYRRKTMKEVYTYYTCLACKETITHHYVFNMIVSKFSWEFGK